MPKTAPNSADHYVAPRIICERYGISRWTLLQWTKSGRIRSVTMGGGVKANHRYLLSDIEAVFGQAKKQEAQDRLVILYARVSSSKQKEAGDLARQVELLQCAEPQHDKVITDVASGINFARPGLTTLLDLVEGGHVKKVVVSYKDRLARFGGDLLERIFAKHGTALHVLQNKEDHGDSGQSHQDELAQDLLAVCNFFVAKNNGRRSHANARSKRAAADKGLGPEGSQVHESVQDTAQAHISTCQE